MRDAADAGRIERLSVNVELASPLDFLPPLPGWRDRSRFRFRAGNLEVFDFDPYSQALAKLERGLYKFPTVDPATLRTAVESLGDRGGSNP